MSTVSIPLSSAPASVHSMLLAVRDEIVNADLSDVCPHGVPAAQAGRNESSDLEAVEWALAHWTGEPAVTWVANDNCCEGCGCPAPYAPWVEARGGYCEGCFAVAWAVTQQYLSTLK